MLTRVRITDVSPRDGLQNEPGVIPLSDKHRLVAALLSTGVDEIEVSSFVPARWVPQLGDAEPLFRALASGLPPTPPLLSALVPNDKGLDTALRVNADVAAAGGPPRLIGRVSVFAAASETFSRKNTNGSIGEVLARFPPVIERAHAAGISVRGYVSTVIACPFEGPIAPAAVAHVAQQLAAQGVDEIDLGDTIGAGTPDTVRALLAAVAEALGPGWLGTPRLALHLHDTFGRAAACVRAALDAGVRAFDGSVAGLGGCPYASVPGRRAPGNISTETLVESVHAAGFTTGVDPAALARAANIARDIVARAAAPAGPA